MAILALLLGSQQTQAQPVKIDPVHASGFESGAVSLKPSFNTVLEGSLNSNTQPQPLVLQVSAPVSFSTFIPIISSEPARLEVVGGGVTILTGQSSAVVMVNAYQAGAMPIVLSAKFGNIVTTGVRVEKTLNETDVAAEMDYCATVFPPSFSVKTSALSPSLYARVFETGVTEFAGPPAGWLVGAGYGPSGTDPRQLAGWNWVAAAYNLQSGNDDEYVASFISPPSSGVYSYVYRSSLDGGGSWTYCDLDGAGSNASQTFTQDQLGKMYVYGEDVLNGTGLPKEADYCVLQFPPSISVNAGSATTTVYGQLYLPGETEAAGAPPGWIAQVGFGPPDSDPRVPVGWTFFSAPYNTQVGNNDEFGAAMQAPATSGQFPYVFRVSEDSGNTWTYCDLDGAGANPAQPFLPSQLGLMTVTP